MFGWYFFMTIYNNTSVECKYLDKYGKKETINFSSLWLIDRVLEKVTVKDTHWFLCFTLLEKK